MQKHGRLTRHRSISTAAAALTDTDILMPGEPATVLETGETRVGDGTSTFAQLKSPKARAFSTKTANYTLTAADDVVVFNGTGLTATLPAAASNSGRSFVVKNINSSALTVATAGGNIDAAATASLAQWAVGRYASNGTQWYSI